MAEIAMRERHAGRSRSRESRGDAIDHFICDARLLERFGFFAAAAENQRIAAFEAHGDAACFRFGDQQAVDESLRRRFAAAALAHFDDARVFADVHEYRLVDEVVDQHDVCNTQHAHRFQREELGVAGAGAD